MCSRWVLPDEMALDHIKSRSRYPELRFVLSNLAPSCSPCNEKKGSGEWELDDELGLDDELKGLW